MTDTQEQQPSVTQTSQGQTVSDDTVIDLQYLFAVWLKWIWIPILLGGVGFYSGYRDLQAFTPVSVASIVVEPNGVEKTQFGVGGFAGQLGLTIGSSGGEMSPFRRLKIMIGSVVFAEVLQGKIQILQVLYSDSWNESAEAWIRPSGEDFERDQNRKAWLKQNLWAPPNLESVANYLAAMVIFEEIDGGPFQRISVLHSDPEFALWLLTTAYFGADDMLRKQDKIESDINRANIQSKMAAETKIQFLEALRELLVAELRSELLLDESLAYTARIIEPARLNNSKTEPNLQRIIGFPAALYAGLGFLLTTLIAIFRRERRKG